MSRPRLLGIVLFVTACGSSSGGGLRTLVEYHLLEPSDACIRVRASPQAPAGQTQENTWALKGKPKDGVAKFGILIGDDWSGAITVTATLHRPCASPVALARQSKKEPAPTGGKVVELNLRLDEASMGDGGFVDDAGPESIDAGLDAGEDAGTLVDAGLATCDGGLGYFVGPVMGGTWHDVAPYAPNGVWLAGAGALFFRSSSGWVSAGSTCAGEHHAAWARADGRVYFGTDDAGLRYTDPDAGSVCQLLPTAALAGDVYGITGFVDAGTVVLYSVTIGGTVLRNTEPVLAAVDRRWDLADAGGKELWTVAGFNQSALFAGGRSGAGANGVIFKFNPATDLWVRESVSINSVVNDISVVSPTLAFAGTEGHDLFIWNGAVWTLANNNMFGKAIYAVKAFGPNEVYATGESALVRQFDGGTWLTLAAFDAGTTGYLARIRGLNSCDLWSAGTNGLVVHSQ